MREEKTQPPRKVAPELPPAVLVHVPAVDAAERLDKTYRLILCAAARAEAQSNHQDGDSAPEGEDEVQDEV